MASSVSTSLPMCSPVMYVVSSRRFSSFIGMAGLHTRRRVSHHFKFILRSSNSLESGNSELSVRISTEHMYISRAKEKTEEGRRNGK
jgi:hypothetical protein